MASPAGNHMDRERPREMREACHDMALLNRYKIHTLIGTGNYARVYRAGSIRCTKEVAIKAINLARTTDNYRYKFLPRELCILRRVNHENICKVYEIIQLSDRIYIVMQLCSRGTIADLLQRNAGPFSEPVARYLFVPTVAAVAYLHANDIAHRDIKIENILLDNNLTPKLTDFSYSCLVRAHKSNTSTKEPTAAGPSSHGRRRHNSIRLNETFCGTLPYLSPEMIRKRPYDPKKTDSWSLGICLFVLFNDRLPFPFTDIKMMLRRQLLKEYDFRPQVEVGDQAHELLGFLLEPEPTKRITVFDLLKHPWLSGPRERPPDSALTVNKGKQ